MLDIVGPNNEYPGQYNTPGIPMNGQRNVAKGLP